MTDCAIPQKEDVDFPYGADPKEALAKLKDRIGDRVVVANVSGGKDSGAMCLWLKEVGIECIKVFADTGWEHPLTYEYLRGPLTQAIGEIHEVRATETLPEMSIRQGMFPSLMRRWCTEDLKVKPIAKFLNDLEDEPINAIGVRASESLKRATYSQWQWSDTLKCETWRPLFYWSDDDVYGIHRRHGIQPNPLYRMGESRVGCWPCISMNKKNLAVLAEIDPGRIDQIRDLEAKVKAVSQAKADAKGETNRNMSAFYYNKAAGIYGIDDAVAWAKKPTRGRKLELFTDGSDGCARWGFCERPAQEAETQADPSGSNDTKAAE